MAVRTLYFLLAASVAAFLASIIYIIVDKTTECHSVPQLPDKMAAYFNGSSSAVVFCLPGYAFADGRDSIQIACSSSWNTDILPGNCVDKNKHPIAVACNVHQQSLSLNGTLTFFQQQPLAETYIQGNIRGLDSSSIQQWDLSNESCHVTEPDPIDFQSITNQLVIEGTELKIKAVARNLNVSEQFNASLRILGFSRSNRIDDEPTFHGVALFVVEQDSQTSAVVSASSLNI